MRPVAVVAALMIPAASWAALRVWVATNMERWVASEQWLPLPTRLLISLDTWAIRVAPFAIVLVVASSPVWVAGIAWASGSLRPAAAPQAERTLLRWWIASLVALGVTYASLVPGAPPFHGVSVAIIWFAFVAHSVSVGAACALQRHRLAAGSSSFGVWRILWTTWVSMILVPVVPIVPGAIWALWRRDGRLKMAREASA
jgi:hypothetical protein